MKRRFDELAKQQNSQSELPAIKPGVYADGFMELMKKIMQWGRINDLNELENSI